MLGIHQLPQLVAKNRRQGCLSVPFKYSDGGRREGGGGRCGIEGEGGLGRQTGCGRFGRYGRVLL
jgi:hypothetical protein